MINILLSPDLFDEDENSDAEFNILALAVLWEKVKGKESFYHDMLSVTESNNSMLDWTTEDI
jgi:hypothetical protein